MQSGPDLFDRELDPQPPTRVGPDRDTVVPFQRLVVNPFLAVTVFVIIVALCAKGSHGDRPRCFSSASAWSWSTSSSSSTTASIAARPAGCSATAGTRARRSCRAGSGANGGGFVVPA